MFGAAFFALCLIGSAARTPGTRDAADDGWRVLFDGRSADAWRCYNRDSFPDGSWVVEDGSLKTRVGTKDECDIITKEKYQDVELELDWRVSPGGNSGIMYRVTELPPPAQTWHSGLEMQILDDEANRDKDPRTLAGALYDLIAPTNKTLRPAGSWNHVRLLVQGNHVEHWLNGKKILEYALGVQALEALIAKSKFKGFPRYAREREGHFALQHHGDEVWFRNIRVRLLPAPRPSANR